MVLKRDKTRFPEAIWNLLYNGIKFPEQGRTISPSKKKDDKTIFEIIVKDSSSGMDSEHLSNSLQNLRKVCTASNVEG